MEHSVTIVNESQFAGQLETYEGDTLKFKLNQEEVATLNKLLVEKECEVKAVIPVRSLEDYFLKITHHSKN